MFSLPGIHTHLLLLDTGLGMARTDQAVVISLTSRPRSEESKLRFYEDVCRQLKAHGNIEANDVIISMMTNIDSDWSFGNGRAQFVTGEL